MLTNDNSFNIRDIFKLSFSSYAMQTQTRVFVTMSILVVLIFGLYLFSDWFSKVTGYFSGDDQKVRLVECMNEKRAILYTKQECAECYEQQQIIGDKAYSLLKVADCDEGVNCNLKELPAWEINGQVVYGKKTLNELSSLTDCKFETK